MKKILKVVGIILIILAIVVLVIYKVLSGPSVNGKEKREIKKYVENYLTKKYGDYNFKVTDIDYEYDMTTLFDYSNPIGYRVDFESDIVSESWVTINGLYEDEYEVDSDYLIQDYYFPDKDGYDTHIAMDSMTPKKELGAFILKDLQKEFEPDAYEVECENVLLNIPEDYGKMPTLEELENDTSLYKVISFDYKFSKVIEDKEGYKERLKVYIKNKYNCDSNIFLFPNNNGVSVSLED